MNYKHLCQNSLLKQDRYQARNSKSLADLHSSPDATQAQVSLAGPHLLHLGDRPGVNSTTVYAA